MPGPMIGAGAASGISKVGGLAGLGKGIGATLGSAGVIGLAAFIGQEIISGIQQKRANKRQEKSLKSEGFALLRQSKLTRQLGFVDVMESRAQSVEDLASIEAMFADAGISASGSALDVLIESKRRLEINVLKIFRTAELQAKEQRRQGLALIDQGKKIGGAKTFFGIA